MSACRGNWSARHAIPSKPIIVSRSPQQPPNTGPGTTICGTAATSLPVRVSMSNMRVTRSPRASRPSGSVTVSDNHGNTATSDMAHWEMALLDAADWSAKWIAAEDEESRLDRETGLTWVRGDRPADKRHRLFRLKFSLPADADTTILTIANHSYDIYVDGEKSTLPARWRRPLRQGGTGAGRLPGSARVSTSWLSWCAIPMASWKCTSRKSAWPVLIRAPSCHGRDDPHRQCRHGDRLG